MTVKMKVKKGDRVVVISGRDKGKAGTVLRAIPTELRVVVEGRELGGSPLVVVHGVEVQHPLGVSSCGDQPVVRVVIVILTPLLQRPVEFPGLFEGVKILVASGQPLSHPFQLGGVQSVRRPSLHEKIAVRGDVAGGSEAP